MNKTNVVSEERSFRNEIEAILNRWVVEMHPEDMETAHRRVQPLTDVFLSMHKYIKQETVDSIRKKMPKEKLVDVDEESDEVFSEAIGYNEALTQINQILTEVEK